ncbi:MAG: DUF1080 domain-containing protein [Verrucomicrobiae bacterium]|nr:DUF1080 domain-containing protein [Verrucomicrobiae bacterium]
MIACALSARAAEIVLDFSDVPVGQTPPGFRSTVAGKGLPGDWRVVLDDAPSAFAPLSSNAPVPAKRHVLAQLSQDPTDERFPILIYENETFGDFTLTTRFKLVGGKVEQMAGVAFRIQDENNFYVVRASGLGKTFRFYKVVNGVRGEPIGPEMEIPAGVWHELAIECKGNQIRCRLNGKEVIPPITDLSFTSGKVGFWTKSDSVSYFADTRISYVPREAPAQVMVREVLAKYTRLRGLRIYAPTGAPPELRIVASARESELGQPGGRAEHDVVERGTIYYQKTKNSVVVVMPLRDRNGDPVAAVWIEMESFPGQTQQSALARAQPILRQLQARVKDAADLIR